MWTSKEVLDHYYLEGRCMLLEIAALFDRVETAQKREGSPLEQVELDPRLVQLQAAVELLKDGSSTHRTKALLELFSWFPEEGK